MPFLPTVLVVDDEIRPQEALCRTLEEDFGVFTASRLAEARAVREREDVQIMFIDQHMPEVSGAAFDAEHRYTLDYRNVADNRACECAAILRDLRRPIDCKLFGTVRTPRALMGSCMASSEGACTAGYICGRHKDAQASAV